MCLNLGRYYRKDKEKFLKGKGSLICCYKVFDFKRSKLESPYRHTHYVVGVNKSNRFQTELTSTEIYYREVALGIHVYLNKSDAKIYLSGEEVVVPVYCKAKNLVAVGEFSYLPSAVFKEVNIRKRDYERALKKLKK